MMMMSMQMVWEYDIGLLLLVAKVWQLCNCVIQVSMEVGGVYVVFIPNMFYLWVYCCKYTHILYTDELRVEEWKLSQIFVAYVPLLWWRYDVWHKLVNYQVSYLWVSRGCIIHGVCCVDNLPHNCFTGEWKDWGWHWFCFLGVDNSVTVKVQYTVVTSMIN